MQNKIIKFDELEVKIAQNENDSFKCGKEKCKEFAYGALIFPNVRNKFNFCKIHEYEIIEPTKIIPEMIKCKTWFIEYFPIKDLPQDIIDLAKQAKITITSFKNEPYKLEGLRRLLKDMIKDPEKYTEENK